MTRIGNTYKGPNGTFTSVHYRRNGEWFGGVWDRQTNKRTYGISVYGSGPAAEEGMRMAEEAAGPGSRMVLPK